MQNIDFNGQKLKEIMNKRKLTLAVAESLTAGNVQAAIGSISGASTFFEGGITVYNLKQKVTQLRIDEVHAAKVNCVSQQVALEMARAVCLKFDSDIGLGTTGYAEPCPEENVVVPYAFYAIWRREEVSQTGQVVVSGRIEGDGCSRVEMQERVTGVVMRALVGYLEGGG